MQAQQAEMQALKDGAQAIGAVSPEQMQGVAQALGG